MMSSLRVLLIDDHPVVLAGCRLMLQRRPGIEVMEASGGQAGLSLNAQNAPDLVILDLSLPDVGGLTILPKLKSDNPDARILVFSMHEDPVFAARAIEAGASGYVAKNDGPDILLDAIDAILRGEIFLSRSMAQKLALMEIKAGDNPLRSLTRRELDVLRLFGSGKSPAEIAAELDINYRTVANVISLIKRKLNIGTTAKLLRIAVHYAKAPP